IFAHSSFSKNGWIFLEPFIHQAHIIPKCQQCRLSNNSFSLRRRVFTYGIKHPAHIHQSLSI
ncbi:MAG TPA: hypothetical protein VJ302_26350, partial [Blastocatellia bacterium]|nr:hypothetical protein [Blastocatellia bacterium]